MILLRIFVAMNFTGQALPLAYVLDVYFIMHLRWPNTVFARALAKSMQRACKDCKKINMASIQESFYLLNASTICTIFPHN